MELSQRDRLLLDLMKGEGEFENASPGKKAEILIDEERELATFYQERGGRELSAYHSLRASIQEEFARKIGVIPDTSQEERED